LVPEQISPVNKEELIRLHKDPKVNSPNQTASPPLLSSRSASSARMPQQDVGYRISNWLLDI